MEQHEIDNLQRRVSNLEEFLRKKFEDEFNEWEIECEETRVREARIKSQRSKYE